MELNGKYKDSFTDLCNNNKDKSEILDNYDNTLLYKIYNEIDKKITTKYSDQNIDHDIDMYLLNDNIAINMDYNILSISYNYDDKKTTIKLELTENETCKTNLSESYNTNDPDIINNIINDIDRFI